MTTTIKRATTPAMMPPIAPGLKPPFESELSDWLEGVLAGTLVTAVGMNLAATLGCSIYKVGAVGVEMLREVITVVTSLSSTVVVMVSRKVDVTGSVE